MVNAPDITRDDLLSKITDDEIAAQIKNGKNRMPRFDLPSPSSGASSPGFAPCAAVMVEPITRASRVRIARIVILVAVAAVYFTLAPRCQRTTSSTSSSAPRASGRRIAGWLRGCPKMVQWPKTGREGNLPLSWGERPTHRDARSAVADGTTSWKSNRQRLEQDRDAGGAARAPSDAIVRVMRGSRSRGNDVDRRLRGDGGAAVTK